MLSDGKNRRMALMFSLPKPLGATVSAMPFSGHKPRMYDGRCIVVGIFPSDRVARRWISGDIRARSRGGHAFVDGVLKKAAGNVHILPDIGVYTMAIPVSWQMGRPVAAASLKFSTISRKRGRSGGGYLALGGTFSKSTLQILGQTDGGLNTKPFNGVRNAGRTGDFSHGRNLRYR